MNFPTKILLALTVGTAIAHAEVAVNEKESLKFTADTENVKTAEKFDQSLLLVRPELSDEITEASDCDQCRVGRKSGNKKAALGKISLSAIAPK